MRKSKYEGIQDEITKQLQLRGEAKGKGLKTWVQIAEEYKTTKQNVEQMKQTIIKELNKINLETK